MRRVSASFEARYEAMSRMLPLPRGSFRMFTALPRGARILAPEIVLRCEQSIYEREKREVLTAAGIDVGALEALQASGVTVKIAGHSFEGVKPE